MNRQKLYKGHLVIYAILLIGIIVSMNYLRQYSDKSSSLLMYKKAGGDTINVAIEISPISYSLSTDTIGGFYYDLLRLISSKYNVKFKFHKFVPLNIAIDGLNNSKFDIIVADIASSDYKEKYLLTEPIYRDNQILVQRKDVSKHELSGLSSDSIWIVSNSPYVSQIRNMSKEVGYDTIYIIQDEKYSSGQLVELTAIGDIKQTIVNGDIALSMLKEYPQIELNTKMSFNQCKSWMLNKGNTGLCNKFNFWIKEIKSTPEYDKLYQRYFNN